jgi:tryptophan synthase alpha subunit
MGRIEARFGELRQRGGPALVAYVTAGDPSPAESLEIVKELDRAGADVIEIGVPFSDPIADGPSIQRAAERALAAGMNLEGALDLVAEAREAVSAPLVLFTYVNPVFRLGLARFAEQAARAGVDGVLLLDLARGSSTPFPDSASPAPGTECPSRPRDWSPACGNGPDCPSRWGSESAVPSTSGRCAPMPMPRSSAARSWT